jgi:hypothetical protein
VAIKEKINIPAVKNINKGNIVVHSVIIKQVGQIIIFVKIITRRKIALFL